MYGRNRRCGDPLVGPPRMGVSDTLGEVSDLAESRNYCMLEQNFLLRVECSFPDNRVSRVSLAR